MVRVDSKKERIGMQEYHEQVSEAAAIIRSQCRDVPTIGLVTGTGLGGLIAGIVPRYTWSYSALPHFPVSTVVSHPGQLMVGHWAGVPVIVLQGRFHLYEGYTPREVTFPVRVLQTLGVTDLIITNAAGGLHPRFTPGQVMMIRDHINLTGQNPLVGSNNDNWGVRFPDMSAAYSPELRQHARAVAQGSDLPVAEGVYAGLTGPALETPAEVRYLQTIGAEAVGFSTVQEVLAAVHAGMRVLGLSILTNVHNPDDPQPASLEDIIKVAEAAAPRANGLIKAVLERIHDA